jgi:hypothetical protein
MYLVCSIFKFLEGLPYGMDMKRTSRPYLTTEAWLQYKQQSSCRHAVGKQVAATKRATIMIHFNLFVHLFISLFITFLLNTLSQSLWKESNIYLFVCSYRKSGSAYGAVRERQLYFFLLTLKKHTVLSNHLSYSGKQNNAFIISKTIKYAPFTHPSIIFPFLITTTLIQTAVSAEG